MWDEDPRISTTDATSHGRNTVRRRTRWIAVFATLALWLPSVASATDCQEFEKQVSVDGGNTWFDADDAASAPSQVVGGGALYRFIVTNCFERKVCVNTQIDDPDLGIFDAIVPGATGAGILQPLEQVIVREDDPGFENLDQPDRCDTPGIKKNTATETTAVIGNPNEPETFMDDAFIECEPPDVTIEKFTNGHDADAADGFPVPTPPNGGFVVGASQVPLVGIGDGITWTYVVKNNTSERLVDVEVTDSEGVTVICPKRVLDPNEEMTCLAMGVGLDLETDPTAKIVPGCDAEGQGTPQPTYENVGTVTAFGTVSNVQLTAADPSHYCNPPDVMVEKFTNGHDGDDPNGVPAPGPGSFDVGATTVAEIPSGEDVTWTYVVTNTGPEDLEDILVTDSQGVTVVCPTSILAAGESITCTATGSADDLVQTGGDVLGCGAGTGETRPTYENLATAEGRGVVSGLLVEDEDPSHYCNPLEPPDCGIVIGKTCELPPPPSPADGKCEGKLTELTMIWDGPDGAQVSGVPTDAVGPIANGDVVTFFGPFSNNDVVVDVSGPGISGQSEFHVSCSDKDMDGDTATDDAQSQVSPIGRDCGKFEGNGKSNDDTSLINLWLLEGFVDDDGAVLDCTAGPSTGATSCDIQGVAADCKFPNDKPDQLTWLYSGGGCGASNNAQKQSGDLFCTGSVDGNAPVTITDDDGNVFDVAPGGVFTTSRSDSKEFTLVNAGGTEQNGRHVSCSQPLQAGDVYGSLTLAALDGAGLGASVVYGYDVANTGSAPIAGITVTDDQLGFVGGIPLLAPGDTASLSATAFVSATTTNVATADGDGGPGTVCTADSNPVVVRVLPPPPCDVSLALKEIKEDAVKWTLSNGNGRATLDTFQLVFPAAYGAIKEVKLDGGIFKSGDSATYPNGVGSGELIGTNDWTESDVSKRQLDPGESRTLEVKFTSKFKNASSSDFGLTATFAEGCMVGF